MCPYRCDRRGADLLLKQAGEDRDIAAREKSNRASVISKACAGGAQPNRTSCSLAELFFELLFALVQRLQSQLPAVQLNGELIDVAGDFSAL